MTPYPFCHKATNDASNEAEAVRDIYVLKGTSSSVSICLISSIQLSVQKRNFGTNFRVRRFFGGLQRGNWGAGPNCPYVLSAQREKKQFPGERPLSSHFMMSSCSNKAYIPTPFNTPHTGTEPESHLPEASSARGAPKPVLKKVAPSLCGGNPSEKDKVHLRGGGPKKRRGAAAVGSRKKAKQDKYSDVDQLLSDFKSPIFQEDANIKAVISHPMAKQTMIDQGESYPFDQMTGDEVATTAADFKLDGTYGRFDSDWMAQAMEASQTRAAGGYDAYLASKFEEQWAEEDEEVSEEEIKEPNYIKPTTNLAASPNYRKREAIRSIDVYITTSCAYYFSSTIPRSSPVYSNDIPPLLLTQRYPLHIILLSSEQLFQKIPDEFYLGLILALYLGRFSKVFV
ncbi:hypothetical protein EYC84_011896 [Monilinia fructicola]|uniref:ASX DEUBAD domain-containing protein n=1 Tax=Monilinia fructicola TaxID=38448 RepID=A0A5M9J7S6_MONFR|nr:hypothetical protein EYC84_011896 [Monilinia fructicola]